MLNLMSWRNGKLKKKIKLMILIFHFTLVIHIFYPLNLNLRCVILNEVSRIFIWTMFWFQQIKLLTLLQLFDNCIILILSSVSLLASMPINCSLLWVRRWLPMGMVVIQPYSLLSTLKKTKTKWLPKLHKKPIKQYLLLIHVLVRQQNFLNC